MFTKTHTDELIEHINKSTPVPLTVLKELFTSFDNKKMRIGVEYYLNNSKIINRQMYAYSESGKTTDVDAINNKLVANFHKILVDQKTAYLVGEPMVFGSRSDNEKALEQLQKLIGERWEDTIPELIKGASNKGVEWLHPFINEDGEFDYMIIPAENLIPIYDYSKRKKLTAAVRFYYLDVDWVKLELWTETDVTYYEMINNDIHLDANVPINPAPHFTNVDETEWKSWERIPFIKFANNEEELSDLINYKSLVDAYDLLVSDAQNTLEDMQSLIYVLKNYGGTDLSEFRQNLRYYKTIKIDSTENGGVDTLKAEVPVEAYKTQIEVLKNNIFTFGQGVNPSPEVIGNAPSGVALTNLYSLLDMKSSILERKFTLALREFMYFVSKYCELLSLEQIDPGDITFTFNKLLLTNEAEIVNMAQASIGVISTQTVIENHPWVKDAQQEIIRLKEEQEQQANMLDNYSTTFVNNQSSDLDE